MDRWDNLNMSQKAQLIGIYASKGYTDLASIINHYNTFQAGGKLTFEQWKSQMQSKYPDIEMDNTKAGYDYNRYFNDSYDDAIRQLSELRHFPDTYKLPNHKTFSNESIYSRGPMMGGRWVNDSTFSPSIINRQQYPNIYKEDRPYTEREIYGNNFATGSQMNTDGPEDPPYPRGYKLSAAIMNLAQRAVDKDAAGYSEVPNNGAPQSTFLMNRKNQQKAFELEGYTKLNNDNYGPVSNAVNTSKHKNVPIYQKYPDANVDKKDLIKVGTFLDHAMANSPYDTDIYNGPADSYLVDPGNFPVDIYIDKRTGKVYNQGWDFNDYHNVGNTTIGVSKLKSIAGNILDKLGNPTVVTTGLQQSKAYPAEADDYLRQRSSILQYEINPATGEYEIMMKPVIITAEGTNKNIKKNTYQGKPASQMTEDEFWGELDKTHQYALGGHYDGGDKEYQQGGKLGKITPLGQWQYPHQVTTIPSNNITMKGVNYPVLGVSDTGDTKYMLPNMDYLFDGNYVTEYPLNHKHQLGGYTTNGVTLSDGQIVYPTSDLPADDDRPLPYGLHAARIDLKPVTVTAKHPYHDIWGEDSVPADLNTPEKWQDYKNFVTNVQERPDYKGVQTFMNIAALSPLLPILGPEALSFGKEALLGTVKAYAKPMASAMLGLAGYEGLNNLSLESTGNTFDYNLARNIVQGEPTSGDIFAASFLNPGLYLSGLGKAASKISHYNPEFLLGPKAASFVNNQYKGLRVANELRKGINTATKHGGIEVSESAFKDPTKFYRFVEQPEVGTIEELGFNVTSRDASDIPSLANTFRVNAINNASRIEAANNPFGISLRKLGSAHGNVSQASAMQPWRGSVAQNNLFRKGILEGELPSTVLASNGNRSVFHLTGLGNLTAGQRIGFRTGTMPTENLRYFEDLGNGMYRYNGQVLPEQRIYQIGNQSYYPTLDQAYESNKFVQQFTNPSQTLALPQSTGVYPQIKPLIKGAEIEKQLSKTGTISRKSLDAYINKQGKYYQELMNDVLESEFKGVDKIDYTSFQDAVQRKLPEYNRVPQTQFQAYGLDNLGYSPYEFIDGFGNPLPNADLKTFTFETKGITGNNKHFDGNPIGHSRTYTTKDEPNVLHVMESQSDWAQGTKKLKSEKGSRIQRIINRAEVQLNLWQEALRTGINPDGSTMEPWGRRQIEQEFIPALEEKIKTQKAKLASTEPMQQYMIETFTERQIQENLKYAAEKGQTKMRYPTRETAAKIEGYEKEEVWFDANGNRTYLDPIGTRGLRDEDLSLEDIRNLSRSDHINTTDNFIRKELYRPEHETILKKYDAFPKQFQKLFGKKAEVRTVTDSKGNTWYEVDVPESYRNKTGQIIFSTGGLLGLGISNQNQ